MNRGSNRNRKQELACLLILGLVGDPVMKTMTMHTPELHALIGPALEFLSPPQGDPQWIFYRSTLSQPQFPENPT